MDDNELRDLKRKVEENNRILKNLQSRARWATFGSILKWVIYFGLVFVAWYYTQPFIDQALEAINTVQGIKAQVDGIDTNSIFEMFKR